MYVSGMNYVREESNVLVRERRVSRADRRNRNILSVPRIGVCASSDGSGRQSRISGVEPAAAAGDRFALGVGEGGSRELDDGTSGCIARETCRRTLAGDGSWRPWVLVSILRHASASTTRHVGCEGAAPGASGCADRVASTEDGSRVLWDPPFLETKDVGPERRLDDTTLRFTNLNGA